MDFSNLQAMDIRCKMNELGWSSRDKISDGWYSMWFERWNWHGRQTVLLTGRSVTFGKHTDVFTKIDAITRSCAEQALTAYETFTDTIPCVNAKGELIEDNVFGDWNSAEVLISGSATLKSKNTTEEKKNN